MATDKLLAEWFWIDRWDGSSASALPIEVRGLYREMLTQAWRRQAMLPNDHDAIKRLCRVSEKEWRRCWPYVQTYWRVDGESLVNDTQVQVYAECLMRSNRAQARAQAGAQARHKKANKQCSSGAQALLSGSVSDLESLKNDSLGARFDAFWNAYPRKVGKEQARKAFAKVDPSQDLLTEILRALEVQSRSPQWVKDDGQFIPHPATWLNQARWQDEVSAPARKVGAVRRWQWEDCPHTPHCGSASACEIQTQMLNGRRERAS